MNIDDIDENSLNNFDPELANLLKIMLNLIVRNQGILESLVNMQREIIMLLPHNIKPDDNEIHKRIWEAINKRTAEIQAEVASKF